MITASHPAATNDQSLREFIGFDLSEPGCAAHDPLVREQINVRLSMLGQPIHGREEDYPYLRMSGPLLADLREARRLLAQYLCPADQRLQDYLDRVLAGTGLEKQCRLPGETLILDRHGMARELSLPANGDYFESPILKSYRLANGVLHNPDKDRRTTQGVFHVVEGGLPIADDKKAVPVATFGHLLSKAINEMPKDVLRLPFTSGQKEEAHCWVSLLIRPVLCPKVAGVQAQKSIEVRFFVPGGLVCNLDFVESIFGNAGDPYLSANDAALDVEHWGGYTGCLILAPHLTKVRKKDVGLPHWDQATERQRRDGMCWKSENELYNDGSAFKVTCRDTSGVVVTIVADNYFGYCKKEVKTILSYSANLYGHVEEEHSGGAWAFPRYDLGEDFSADQYVNEADGYSFAEMLSLLGERAVVQPEGHALDRDHADIVYLPEHTRITLQDQRIAFRVGDGPERTIKLLAGRTYVFPSGYQVELMRPAEGRRWRLVGTVGEGTSCHKPCTVSGGGKSEISKSIADAILHGPVYVANFQEDFDQVEAILHRDFTDIFRDTSRNGGAARPILGPQRSLGSVIKLLTPSEDYSDAYNAWLGSIPEHVRELVLIVKRFWKADWGPNWRWRFSVDTLNGRPGNELKYRNQKLIASYLRVGYEKDGGWRVFGLRKDFMPAAKVQTQDDITASVVLPAEAVKGLNPEYAGINPSVKFVHNCEYRLFQRPDDAFVRGYDKQAERDMSRPGNFFSNYQPLTRPEVGDMVDDVLRFSQFTEPMQEFLGDFAQSAGSPEFAVCNANPRLVDGKPTKNPRYLQNRPDLENPRGTLLAELGVQLARRLPVGRPVPMPVNAVMPGRRNNPPEAGVRPLCCYNPVHFMELPEFIIEVAASITGRSPSTTGAGSEGALTKGPFNNLLPVHDLNALLVSMATTGYDAFVSCAGHVGPNYRMDHDLSLLMPEVWSRMRPHERQPRFLIDHGCLERVEDVVEGGETVAASRLGWRITQKFVKRFYGRIFSNPAIVFPEDLLRPEKQSPAVYVDAVKNVLETHERVGRAYFADGSFERAVPPLQVLLHIMAHGHWQGKTLRDPAVRALFTREAILASDWYHARLVARQRVETRLWERHVAYLERFLQVRANLAVAEPLALKERLNYARERLAETRSAPWLAGLRGTIGADPTLVAG